MCIECGQVPCHIRCPNAVDPEAEYVGECFNCKFPITDDYIYITGLDDSIFCREECFKEYYEFKEVE